MSEDDLKAILAKYQQKTFELFNQNIVLETQIEELTKVNVSLREEVQKLSKSKRNNKEEEFV